MSVDLGQPVMVKLKLIRIHTQKKRLDISNEKFNIFHRRRAQTVQYLKRPHKQKQKTKKKRGKNPG